MSFDKQAYNNEYNKRTYTGISIRLNNQADADVLDFLQKENENTKALICKLIRTEIKRRRARKGWQLNNGDRKLHADIKRYPFEVIELLAFNDRYTVGFAASIEGAQDLVYYYQARNEAAGPLAIYERRYDPDLHTRYAVQVID